MDAKLNAIIESMHDEMIDTLQKWIRVPSVKGEAAPGAPFGKEVRSMLDMALADCEQMGFKTQNFDGYIAHADLGEGSDEDALAILAHLDVVPEGDGWKYPPYGAVIENGRMYGRGTSDDKGPAVAALYAMKAVKDAGIPLRHKVRLILGCDEESGWEDIAHYNKVATMPRMGFSPDASYPIINIEKGICRLELHGVLSNEGLQVIAFNNGERPNVIPGRASALVAGDAATVAQAEAAAKKLDIPAEVQLTDKGVSITVTGISGHAAYPETARNANGEMLLLLRELGICLFLASVGISAGDGFADAVFNTTGMWWVIWGFVITVVPLLIIGSIARGHDRTNFLSIMGLMSGSYTDPPALAYANNSTGNDAPAVAYATVYPLTMFLRVVAAQILILAFAA